MNSYAAIWKKVRRAHPNPVLFGYSANGTDVTPIQGNGIADKHSTGMPRITINPYRARLSLNTGAHISGTEICPGDAWSQNYGQHAYSSSRSAYPGPHPLHNSCLTN